MKEVFFIGAGIVLLGALVVLRHRGEDQRDVLMQMSDLGAQLDRVNGRHALLKEGVAQTRALVQAARGVATRGSRFESPAEAEAESVEGVGDEPVRKAVDIPALAVEAFQHAPVGGDWAREAEGNIREQVRNLPNLASSLESLACRDGVCELMLAIRDDAVSQGILLQQARSLDWRGPMVGIPRSQEEGYGARILLARSSEDIGVLQ